MISILYLFLMKQNLLIKKMEALANNPALLNALQSRLNTLVGKSSGYVESLPQEIQDKLVELGEIQQENLKVELEFRSQVLELEKKFFGLHLPLYQKRFEIVSGKNADGNRGIPAFWFTAMSTHPLISEMIHDGDEEALKHLLDIKVEYLDGNPGFKLEFLFEENAFFTNKSLVKTYYLSNNPDDPFGDLIYQKAVGTSIDWKPDCDLRCKVEMKKQRHKGTKETRMVKKTIPRDTFFNFFSPIQLPQEDEEEDQDLPEDFEEKIEMDYEIGEILKEKIVPRAVDWFTGVALQDEDMDEWDDDEEEEEGEDDEDDENQENPEKVQGENPPECKQQ
jgi:nucleosome assembly protein 1-like 1